MTNRIAVAAVAAVFVACAKDGGHDLDTSSAAESTPLELRVRLNGYVLDLKGPDPAVPPELEPAADSGYMSVVDAPADPGIEPPARGKQKNWIVQLTGPVRAPQKRQLVDLGCRVAEYLPDFAFLVAMDEATRAEVAKLPFVHGLARYKPAYKIERKLKDDAGSVRTGDQRLRLHVRVDRPESIEILVSRIHKKKGKVLNVARDLARVELEPRHVGSIAHLEEVLWVEEAVDVELFNDVSRWTIQSYVPGDTRISDAGLLGQGQIVGVGDTGLDHDMCWFRDPSGEPIGPTHRKVVGYATYADDHDGNFGHGTHVSGTVAGDQHPITGATTANGMAPRARLFATDLTPGESGAVYPPDDLGDMFVTPYLAGARLHTNSWGANVNRYDTMAWSADRFMWEHKDFLALFANGNAGPGPGTVGTPANAKDVVSVGATVNGNGAETVAWFSSHGLTADGRIKPTVTAPGVSISSADSDGVNGSNNCGTTSYSGTSMATPTVAGAAALVRQYFVDGYWPSGTATPGGGLAPSAALVKATLVNTAQNAAGEYTGGPIPSTGQGWGRINLSNSLRFAAETQFLDVADVVPGLETGASHTRTFYAGGEEPMKVTLVWTDYPGSTNAAVALVNDLDLTVTGPDGVVYTGNAFASGVSLPGGAADRRNVEEQVLVPAPRGSYRVVVSAYNVPYGPQPFALVVTGASGVSSTGFVALDRTRYNAASTIEVKVGDRDLNADPAAVDEAFATIRSTSDAGGERVVLVETGPDTNLFTGTIRTAPVPAAAGDGVIQVAEGDTITAVYDDARDAAGLPATVTATATADLTPPVISAVTTVSIEEASATVAFSTNEPARPSVAYGETPELGAAETGTGLGTAHRLQLGHLKEATRYLYAALATDEAGNVARDDAGGALHAFTTLTLPPSLEVHSSNGTPTYHVETVIFGLATDPSGVTAVTVNGTAATYRAGDGYYELLVPLAMGDNPFTVVATDALGNAKTESITVSRVDAPDLVITTVAGPSQGGVAEVIHTENTVCNVGSGPAPWSGWVAWYLSTDDVITPATDVRFDQTYSSGAEIAPGACISFPADIRVPNKATLIGNTYWLGAYVDVWNQVWEGDETNNGLAGNRIQLGAPDLVVTNVAGPDVVYTGRSFTVDTAVRNSGVGGSNSTTVGVYLSTDAVIDRNDRMIGSRSTGFLGAGQSSAGTVTVTIPSSVPFGEYHLGAIVDPWNGIPESDDGNNGRLGHAIRLIGPDLSMSALSGPAQARTGDTISVPNTVTASAAGGDASQFVVRFYLSTDATITSGDVYIGERTVVNGLPSGQSSTVETPLVIPRTMAGGTYHLGAIADPYNGVAETNEGNNAIGAGQIAITGPDLEMVSVSGPATGLTAGSIVVQNTVAAAATGGFTPGFHVGIFLSSDAVITEGDMLLGVRWVEGLAPGASSADATAVTLPGNIGSGTYYIGAIADNFGVGGCDEWECWEYRDAAKEPNDANNVALGGPIAVSGTDLVVGHVSGGGSAFTGKTYAIRSTVTASGGGAGSFTVSFYLSADATITTSDVRIGDRVVQGLAAGASSTADTTVTVPVNVAPGTYRLGAIVDSANQIPEDGETNNALAGNEVTVTGADLTVAAVSGPTNALSGATISVNTTVAASATGGNAGWFEVGLYLSKDAVITTSDPRIGSRWVSSLAAGATSAGATSVTIPNVEPGTWYLGAIADVRNDVKESEETNNARVGNEIAVVGPDLTATGSAPAGALAGETITVSNTVTAAASGSGAGSFYVTIYLSADPVITTGDRQLAQRYVSGLAPGASSTASTAVTIPTDVGERVWYVGVLADPYGYVRESDEGNNAWASALAVTAPDLFMTSVSGPANAVAGDPITVENTVAASAAGGNAPGFHVGIFLSADPLITEGDMLLGHRWVGGLAPGGSSVDATAVQIPYGLASGTYYLGAIADNFGVGECDEWECWEYRDAAKESDEANNALTGNAIQIGGADLVATQVSGPASAGTGQTITVRNTVTAVGGGASAFTVGLYLSADAAITKSDRYLGARTVSRLDPGASSTEDTVVTIPLGLAAGTYTYGAIADTGSAVVESDEINNALAGNTMTVVLPDLTVTAVSAPGTASSNAAIAVDTTVAAAASGGNAGSFYVGIYLSRDATITTADTLIGSVQVPSLAAGATRAATTTVTIPGSIAPGQWYIGARADVNGHVAESDEGNNGRAGNAVTVIGPDVLMAAVSGPAGALTGATITVSSTVTAAPSGANPTSFTVGFYLSADDVITTGDVYLGSRTVSGLVAGGSSTAETSLGIPTTIAGGLYRLGAIADVHGQVPESDETNNARPGGTFEVIGPDLAMTAVIGPPSARTGDPIVVENTVAASVAGGNAPGFHVGIFLSADPLITEGDMLLGYRWVNGLAPGAWSTELTAVAIPGNLASGTYYLGAIADDFGVGGCDDWECWEYRDAAKEPDDANNVLLGGPITVGGVDLATAEVSGPVSAVTGKPYAIRSTVTASGGGAGWFTVAFYLSADATITTSDVRIGDRVVQGLAAGSSSTADTTVTIPVNVAPGTYRLGAIVDSGNQIPEDGETNNALAGNAVTVTGSDLTVAAVSGPASGLSGGTISVDTAVVASATGGNAGWFEVGLYLSRDAVITTSDVRIGSRYVSSLAAGATSGGATSVTVPNVEPGAWYLGAVADVRNDVKESDEANNARAGSAISIVGPDLTASGSAPAGALAGGTITVSNTVTAAASGARTGSFYVTIYLSADPVITTADRQLAQRYVSGGLAAGASSSASTAVTVPTDIAGGTWYVGALADPYGYVLESDEGNNAWSSALAVTAADVLVTSVSGPATAAAGGTITVQNTVEASVAGGHAPGFHVGVFLSSDPVITEGDTLLGYRWVNGLAPGASSVDATVVQLPTGLASGTYYVGAIADDFTVWYDDGWDAWPVRDLVRESDATNNALTGNAVVIGGGGPLASN